jgi:hypothetical protein
LWHNREKKIRLLFSGDKGGTTTKLCVAFGDAPKPNSISNVTIVGIYEGQDNRKLLEHYVVAVFDQINSISTLHDIPVEW